MCAKGKDRLEAGSGSFPGSGGIPDPDHSDRDRGALRASDFTGAGALLVEPGGAA